MMNTKAFTLIETLVSAALLSVIMLGVYGVLLTGNNIYSRDTALLEMEQQTRNALDRIVREVRQASSQTITTNYNNTTNDKITFTIPQAAGIKYYLNGTNLVREYPNGTMKTLASNVALLKFTQSGSLLQIQARADKTIYARVTSFALMEKVRLRNE